MRSLVAAALFMISAGVVHGQAPDADIFLVSLARKGDQLTVTGARNLTSRPGYDNQPNWSPDGRTLFFTSVREGEQADIYRLDPAGTATPVRVTLTAPESEYSATPMPRRNAISVIRVERDSTQRLWSVPLDGSAGAVVLERIKPVGYHTWANDTLLALFVLGSPNTLQLASTTTGRADTIVTSIGRSLHTTREGQVSFVHKVSNGEWWLTLLDPSTRQLRRLVRMPPRVEDYAWTPDGLVLAGEGSVLKAFDPRRGGEWTTVADLAAHGLTGITRLSVSPRADAVAVVAQPAAPRLDQHR
jgi:dipeptidyl aminopeptidase/acylaminoacyl peptidase